MKLHPIKSAKKGFSLVEMLVVIAVIGIIAAIAVPNIGNINNSAKDATYRRNAQSIASVYASAQAAGYDFAKTGGTGTAISGETNIIKKVIEGATIPSTGEWVTSPFKGAYFGVPNMDVTAMTSDTAGPAKYLEWVAGTGSAPGTLRYVGDK